MKNRRYAFGLVTWALAFGLTACPHTDVAEESVIAGSVSGRAMYAGPIVGGSIGIFDATDGVTGAAANGDTEVGRTQTDEAGAFRVAVGPLSGNFIIQARVGPADGVFEAFVPDLALGEQRSALVTPMTHLTAAYARHLMDRSLSPSDAMSKATRLIDGHFAQVAHAVVPPVDLSDWAAAPPVVEPRGGADTTRVVTREVIVAVLHRGLLEMAEDWPGGSVDPNLLVTALGRDIRADGVFDGVDEGGPIRLGATNLDAETLRSTYAQAIRDVLSDVGLPASDFRLLLERIENNESEMFVEGALSSRDREGPRVVRAVLLDRDQLVPSGQAVRGDVAVLVEATDESGVASIGLVVREGSGGPGDGLGAGTSSTAIGPDTIPNPEAARFTIDTTRLPDGVVPFAIELADTRDNVRVMELLIVVDNTGPDLRLSVPRFAERSPVRVTGSVVDSSTVASLTLTINGSETLRIDRPSRDFEAELFVPCEQVSVVSAVAHDVAGNASRIVTSEVTCSERAVGIELVPSTTIQERDLEVRFSADGTRAMYLAPSPSPGPTPRTVTLSEATQWPVTFEKYLHRLDDLVELGGTQGLNIPVLRFVVIGAFGDVEVQYRYTRNGGVFVDWSSLDDPSPQGVFELPLSYQRLGPALATDEVSALHRVELRVIDGLGRTGEASYPFFVDLLAPAASFVGCAAAGALTAPTLGQRYTATGGVVATTGTLRYPVDLPARAIASRGGIRVRSNTPVAHTRLTTLGEERFSPVAWGAEQEVPAINTEEGRRTCNVSGNARWHRVDFPFRGTSLCTAGLAPDDADFWTAAADGVVNDLAAHVAEVRFGFGSVFLVPVNGEWVVPSNVDVEVGVDLINPRVRIGGRPYDWRRTFSVPDGFVSTASHGGRYRLPAAFDRSGVEFRGEGVRQLPWRGTVSYFVERPYATRPYVAEVEVTTEQVLLSATHAHFDLPVVVHATEVCRHAVREVIDAR